MKLYITAATNRGGQLVNQDRILVDRELLRDGKCSALIKQRSKGVHICAVADGVTKCKDGALAAEVALTSLRNNTKSLRKIMKEPPSRSEAADEFFDVRELIGLVNNDVLHIAGDDDNSGIYATTLSLLTYCRGMIITACIGDSPVFLMRGDQCYIMNDQYVDANRRASMDEMGCLTSKSNLLETYIGNPNEVVPKSYCVKMRPHSGDKFLLASDGVTNALGIEEIVRVCKGKSKDRASELVRLVNETNSEYIDNVSAVLVECV